MDVVQNLIDSMTTQAAEAEEEEGNEMPKVVPMGITHTVLNVRLYTVRDVRMFTMHETCTPRLLLDLIDVWRTEKIPYSRKEEAVRAFQVGFRFRVVCGPDGYPAACEITFENERWVWLSSECVYELAQELFN